MANAKALAEKEKGNAAFKAADYPTAIGHYSAAIVADRNDHTFPLNRAAAYLKLGKYEDAERDCTTVLALSALNAKALFRRGQARVALGKLDEAVSDLSQASKREPTNAAITEEIKKVEALATKRKQKAPAKPISVPTTPPAIQKRRRVPIEIVDSSAAPSVSEPSKKPAVQAGTTPKPQPTSALANDQTRSGDTLKAISSRPLDKSSATAPKETPKPVIPPAQTAAPPKPTPTPAAPATTVPTSPQPEQPRTFKDAKAARETTRPSRVGGGIFRASGQNTIFPTREATPPGSTPPSSKEPKVKSTAEQNMAKEGTNPAAFSVKSAGLGRPATLFDFARSWEARPASVDRWALITAIPPLKIPGLFQTSLETSLLVSILTLFTEVLQATGTSGPQGKLIQEYMRSFGDVKRFETVLLFMSKPEKKMAIEIWEKLGVGREDVGSAWSRIWS